MATVITLAGRGAQASDIMSRWYNGFAVAPGNTWVNINYVSQADGVYTDGVGKLNTAIAAVTPGTETVVIGHSLGAQIVGQWIRQYGPAQSAKASYVRFVLTGNPERRYGRVVWDVNGSGPVRYVPDDTAFTVSDVARRGDGWANWPRGAPLTNIFNSNGWNLGAVGEAVSGLFTIHLLYQTIDLTNLNGTQISSYGVGNTTYHLMP